MKVFFFFMTLSVACITCAGCLSAGSTDVRADDDESHGSESGQDQLSSDGTPWDSDDGTPWYNDSDGDGYSDGDNNSDTDDRGDTDTFETCAETKAAGIRENAKTNLIIAVDTSSSMRKETELVQENINNRFAEKFGSRPDVDVNIVLIAEGYPTESAGMCVSTPLGSGNCPDDTNPGKAFWHIHEYVGSSSSLDRIIDCYDGGPWGGRCDEEGHWKDFINQDGFVHFVVVTDDNSSMRAYEFEAWAKAEFGNDYMFHGIVSNTDRFGYNSTPECEEYSASEGTVYKELISRTDGTLGDLCLQENNEFDTVFDNITTKVITHVKMPCEWTIPTPPGNADLDPEKVNVEFVDGATIDKIGKVVTQNKCAEVQHGWYYDNDAAPTQIFVCPQTCAWIQNKPDAEMNIKFGCKTEDAGPVI